ncbi:hypothetical protein ES703_65898 [subsurface metagenome]
MRIEKLESVGVNVKNLDEAVELFSDILDTTFVILGAAESKQKKTVTEHATHTLEGAKLRGAMDRRGFLELLESTPPVEKEGLRNIRFKVPNIEEAKAEMQQKGIRLIADVKAGGSNLAIFNPEDLHGIRLVLTEYETPTQIDAIRQE